jgi:signal peptidase I
VSGRSSLRSLLREWSSLLIIVAVVLTARSSLADHYVVPSGSMEPTVQIGDHVVVNKLAYGIQAPLLDGYLVRYASPARGDVVVLHSPETGIVLLKRVVAVPGDVVRVIAGKLTLNGAEVKVEERAGGLYEALGMVAPHPLELDDGGGPDFGPVKVPKGQVLVLGDNRGNSKDGRYFGFVSEEEILGRSAGVCLRGGSLTWRGL